MTRFEEVKNFFLIWLCKVREFFGNHYSYELEGFSLHSSETFIIYKVKGKHQTYKKKIADGYNDHFFLSTFSPLNVKQICAHYHAESSIIDNTKLTDLRNLNLFIPVRFFAKKHRFLPSLSMLYIVVLIVAILLSPDLVKIGYFTEPRGILLFPLTYLIADVISEVYGYQIVRLIIWSALACLIASTIAISISLTLPNVSRNSAYYHYVFGNMPHLLLANGLSMVISDFSNAYLFSKLKIITHGKYLWLRVIGASATGEITYTIVWIGVFFVNQFSINQMLSMAVQNYFFKVLYSALFIPFAYWASVALKRKEGIDMYDHDISYNIFSTHVDDPLRSDQKAND